MRTIKAATAKAATVLAIAIAAGSWAAPARGQAGLSQQEFFERQARTACQEAARAQGLNVLATLTARSVGSGVEVLMRVSSVVSRLSLPRTYIVACTYDNASARTAIVTTNTDYFPATGQFSPAVPVPVSPGTPAAPLAASAAIARARTACRQQSAREGFSLLGERSAAAIPGGAELVLRVRYNDVLYDAVCTYDSVTDQAAVVLEAPSRGSARLALPAASAPTVVPAGAAPAIAVSPLLLPRSGPAGACREAVEARGLAVVNVLAAGQAAEAADFQVRVDRASGPGEVRCTYFNETGQAVLY